MTKLQIQALKMYDKWWNFDVDIRGFQAELAKFFEVLEERYPNQTRKIREKSNVRNRKEN